MTRTFNLLTIMYIDFLVQSVGASFDTYAMNLRSTILSSGTNDPIVRPNQTVLVKAGFSLLAINSVDNVQQSLTMTGWLTLKWSDYRLAWQPSSFDDIQEIHVMPSEVWNPEVIIPNSLADVGVITDDNLQLTVTNTGDVLWEPPGLYTIHCEIDVTYYPFDRQKCVLELTSWSMTKDQLELDHTSTDIDTGDFRTNGEWILLSTSVTDTDQQDTKPGGTVVTFCELDFIFVLQRRPAFYAINYMLPIILSSFLSCVVFLVPITAGEKVSYILTMILAIAVLLTLVADSLPHTSLTASVLGIYLAITMSLSVLCAIVTVLLVNIFHRKEKVDITSSFYKLTLFIATYILFQRCKRKCKKGNKKRGNKVFPNGSLPAKITVVGRINEITKRVTEPSTNVNGSENYVYTWADIAKVWDRFCFWAFITVTSLCTLSCLVALAVGGKKDYV